MGVPVIASNLGPLADRVQPEIDGLLVEVGDVGAWQKTLQRLIAEPDLLARLGQNTKPSVTIGEYGAQIEGLYNEAI